MRVVGLDVFTIFKKEVGYVEGKDNGGLMKIEV